MLEETVIGGKNYLIWWVEIDGNGLQVLVLADVVDGNRRAQATTRAGKYLMTFSDDYLDRCLMREVDDNNKVLPKPK
eukprot:g28752.t1